MKRWFEVMGTGSGVRLEVIRWEGLHMRCTGYWLDQERLERLCDVAQALVNQGAVHVELRADPLGWVVWS